MKLRHCLAVLAVFALVVPAAMGEEISPAAAATDDPIELGSLDNVIDGVINHDQYVLLGDGISGPFGGPYTVTFDLGDRYDLTAINLWNNAGASENDGEGIDAFNLRFLDIDDVEIDTFSDSATDTLAKQAFGLDVEDVAHVELTINSNHDMANRVYAGFYEVNFEGTLVPEPCTMTLLAAGGLALVRRRR